MRGRIWASALLLGIAACGDAATNPGSDNENPTELTGDRGQAGGTSTINPSMALANSVARDCPQRCVFAIGDKLGRSSDVAVSITEEAGVLLGSAPSFRWSRSRGRTTLATPAGYTRNYGNQQNGWGQVAGSTSDDTLSVATVWEPDGTPIILSERPYGPPLPGVAYAINDNSVIVGSSGGRAFRTHYKEGFRWLSGPGSVARDVNFKGEVVGYSTIDGARHATVWAPDGTPTDLGIISDRYSQSVAVAISETGIVVGYSYLITCCSIRFAGFMWTREQGMTLLPVDFFPSDVNHWGEVAGRSESTRECAVYYKGYGVLHLPRTSDSKAGCNTTSINSWGDVSGYEKVDGTIDKPLLWTWGGNEGRYGF